NPFFGFAVSQKKRKVRASRSISTGSTTGLVLGADTYRPTIPNGSPARLDVKSSSRVAQKAISATVWLGRKRSTKAYKQSAHRTLPQPRRRGKRRGSRHSTPCASVRRAPDETRDAVRHDK